MIKEAGTKFAQNTSCHGFLELYYAKSWCWRFFWVFIIFGSFAITTYQVSKAVAEFASQDAMTVIALADKEDFYYPPISLCFGHWIQWVDWQKAIALNFTKENTLVGLSYLTYGFSSSPFNLTQAKNQFIENLHSNNFSTISEFYSAIARRVPLSTDDNETAGYFSKKEIIYKHPNILYCYTIPENLLYKILLQQQTSAASATDGIGLTFSLVDQTFVRTETYVTVQEYNHHIGLWLNSFSTYQISDDQIRQNQLTDVTLPTFLYPNLYSKDSIEISSDNDKYLIDFRISAHRWKNTPQRPCLVGNRSVFPDDLCFRLCESTEHVAKCQCPFIDNAALVQKDFPQSLCTNDIHFLSGIQNGTEIDVNWLQEMNANCSDSYEATDKKCKDSCRVPCETWYYDMGVSVRAASNSIRSLSKKRFTFVSITYPATGNVFIATDVDPQTWESFIGNVGGLLGIWTGASIVSIIQIAYYFCCCFTTDNISLHRRSRFTKDPVIHLKIQPAITAQQIMPESKAVLCCEEIH